MPEICNNCGDPNSEPHYQGCPACRALWRKYSGYSTKGTKEYNKGWHDALMMAKENFLTPDLCNSVMDCVNVCDRLLE